MKKFSLHWHYNGRDSVSNHLPQDCLLNRLYRRRSKKLSKLRVSGLFAGNSPETGEFPAQIASNAECVSIWWRHHGWVNLYPVIWRNPWRVIRLYPKYYRLGKVDSCFVCTSKSYFRDRFDVFFIKMSICFMIWIKCWCRICQVRSTKYDGNRSSNTYVYCFKNPTNYWHIVFSFSELNLDY